MRLYATYVCIYDKYQQDSRKFENNFCVHAFPYIPIVKYEYLDIHT